MSTPHMSQPAGSWRSRVAGFLHGPSTSMPAEARTADRSNRGVEPGTESWSYRPPLEPAGFQEIQACRPDGYDFARMVWQTCASCRLGLIAKIRVTGPWQRHGYATRMVRFALHDRDGFSWSTTPQSAYGRAFFGALAQVTGIAFPGRAEVCEHMRVRRPQQPRPWQTLEDPPR